MSPRSDFGNTYQVLPWAVLGAVRAWAVFRATRFVTPEPLLTSLRLFRAGHAGLPPAHGQAATLLSLRQRALSQYALGDGQIDVVGALVAACDISSYSCHPSFCQYFPLPPQDVMEL